MCENSGVEARRVESRGEYLMRGGQQSSIHQLVGLAERCKLPQQVCLEIEFRAFWPF